MYLLSSYIFYRSLARMTCKDSLSTCDVARCKIVTIVTRSAKREWKGMHATSVLHDAGTEGVGRESRSTHELVNHGV